MSRRNHALQQGLEALASARLEVDVVARVMNTIHDLEPAPRIGLGPAARRLIYVALGGLLAQGAWTTWGVASGGGAGQAVGFFGTLWAFLSSVVGIVTNVGGFLLDFLGGLLDSLSPVLDAVAALWPLWYGAILAGFLLLLAASWGVIRMTPQRVAGELT